MYYFSGEPLDDSTKANKPSLEPDKSDTSEDEDNLVVDETLKKTPKNKIFGLPGIELGKGPHGLKLKLGGKSV